MEELEQSSVAWDREWKSSSKVRGLESGMEVFEQSSDSWNREWKSSRQVRTWLELFYSRFQASELSSNVSISDSKLRTFARTPPFPIPRVII